MKFYGHLLFARAALHIPKAGVHQSTNNDVKNEMRGGVFISAYRRQCHHLGKSRQFPCADSDADIRAVCSNSPGRYYLNPYRFVEPLSHLRPFSHNLACLQARYTIDAVLADESTPLPNSSLNSCQCNLFAAFGGEFRSARLCCCRCNLFAAFRR